MMLPGVHSDWQPQMSCTKRCRIAAALRGVRHLRMELHAIEAARLVGDAGERRGGGFGNHLEARRQFGDPVAVAHPYVQPFAAVSSMLVADVAEQLRVAVHAHPRVTELAFVAGLDRAAQLRRHGLLAVADAEDGNLHVEDFLRRARRLVQRHRFRTTGKNDAARGEFPDFLDRRVIGIQLAIHPGLAHAARDQLRVLRAEIENQDFL